MFRGFLGSFLNDMMSSHRSNIESLLDKDDTKLETLLEDSEILTQCKWGNQRLVNYFDHDKVSQLLDFITQMPPEGCTHDRGHKFPFVASEIFNCELNKINDLFFQPRPEQISNTSQTNNKQGKGKYSIQSDDEDEDDVKVEEINNDKNEQDVQMSNQDDDFERLIQADSQNDEESNTNNVVFRKSFGDTMNTRGSFGNKPAKNRYEVEEDEEVDHDEIDLRTDETIEDAFAPPKNDDTDNKPAIDDDHVEIIPEDQEENKEELPQPAAEEIIENLNKQVDVINDTSDKQDAAQSIIQDDYIQEDTNHHEDEINLEDVEMEEHQVEEDDEDDNRTVSTAVTKQEIGQKHQRSEYELFEKLLSFLDTDEELNPVLTGYFCKLFQVLVGNKPKEVFGYIYSHPNILDNFVKHINDKSVSEILIRLLNVSDNIFEDSNNNQDDEAKDAHNVHSSSEFDGIRQSYIYKIVLKFSSPESIFEDYLNSQSMLSELVEYKLVYLELTSQRCLDIYSACLAQTQSSAAKASVYQLLQSIVQKYKQNEHFSKKINISNFQDCGDDMMLDDEEDVLVFSEGDKESAFFTFIKQVITDFVAKDLAIPHEDDQEDVYFRQYGICKEPFGMVRIRAVEFLTQVYQIFFKDIHQTLADTDLYSSLLFFLDHYPFHNILHLKINDIFTLALDKNNEIVINHFLYQTSLIKKILDSFRDNGGIHTFHSTGQTVNRGYIAFMRKLANKIDEVSKKNEEVKNFLESIPEWDEFYKNVLCSINAIENKPLGSDPRKKDVTSSDDYFDMIYKIKDKGGRSGYQSKDKKSTANNDEEEEEEDDNVLDGDDNKQDDASNTNNLDDEDDEDANRNKDLYFSNELGAGKSRNKRNKAYAQDGNDEEDEVDNEFDRLIYRQDDDDDDQNLDNNNNDLQQYFSNGDDQTKKPWESHDDEEEGQGGSLTMNDFIQENQETDTPIQSQPAVQEAIAISLNTDIHENVSQVIVEAKVEQVPEVPQYHAQFFWKDNLTVDNSQLDALLQDYE